MTTLVVTLTSICSGGEHLTYTYSGAAAGTVPGSRDDISTPMTPEERAAFVKGIAKLAKGGRTVAAAVALLQAGVSITV